MAKFKFICPHCRARLVYATSGAGKKVKCPHCHQVVMVPAPAEDRRVAQPWLPRRNYFVLAAVVILLLLVWPFIQLIRPVNNPWPDRRPIGVLMLASHFHSSPSNPRGWFNRPGMDIKGTNGVAAFRCALLEYTDRSIANLKRMGAQGVIVWDLEGEEYPHKTTYIGDPRQLDRLAPEMEQVADEFFQRLQSAGFRVGVTIRPQELAWDHPGEPSQSWVINEKNVLEQKIDYARKRWGATLFYLDSTGGIRRPDEVWQLRCLAAERPDVLLIPEHCDLFYAGFSAPYIRLSEGAPASPSTLARKLFPQSFQAIDIDDASSQLPVIMAAWNRGDILLCRAWNWNADCQILENLARQNPMP
jgi:LSD1 subclass zinc finger protein